MSSHHRVLGAEVVNDERANNGAGYVKQAKKIRLS